MELMLSKKELKRRKRQLKLQTIDSNRVADKRISQFNSKIKDKPTIESRLAVLADHLTGPELTELNEMIKVSAVTYLENQPIHKHGMLEFFNESNVGFIKAINSDPDFAKFVSKAFQHELPQT